MDDAQRIATLEADYKNLASWMKKIDEKLEKIGSRPPVWVTVIISILTLAIGWLLKLQ